MEEHPGLDTICYNILTNNFEEATIEIYNPYHPDIPVTVNLAYLRDTKISVKLENDVPKIKCTLNIKASILSGTDKHNFSTKKSLEIFEAEINKFLEKSVSDFLYKTSTEFNSDIVGFEGYFNRNYLTQKQLDKHNWQELYPKATFEIEPHTYLISGFLFAKD